MGYEEDDPVRVTFPFTADGESVIAEGVVVAAMGGGYYRIVFDPPTDFDGCLVEQAIVHRRHFHEETTDSDASSPASAPAMRGRS